MILMVIALFDSVVDVTLNTGYYQVLKISKRGNWYVVYSIASVSHGNSGCKIELRSAGFWSYSKIGVFGLVPPGEVSFVH